MIDKKPLLFGFVLVFCISCPVNAICTSEFSDTLMEDEQNLSLSVALYPFITDVNKDKNTYLLSLMKQKFQQENPSINLTLSMSEKYDCYNLSNLPEIFSENGPQLVEVDLSLLGYLADNGYLTPYRDPSLKENILPQALSAGTYLNETYSIPTYICSQFLFSRDKTIMNIHNVTELSQIMQNHSSEYGRMIAGDFQGGGMWMLPMLYVFAYTDNSDYRKKLEAIYGPVNKTSILTMAQTMNWCSANGTNDCLNGYFYSHSPTKVFVTNTSYTYNGFSENLYHMQKTDPDISPYIISTPYGSGQNPLIWVDGLVINQNACDDQCMENAGKFIKYYNSLETKNLIAFSEDAYIPSPPRYILPATQDFYETKRVLTDSNYMKFYTAIKSAESFPSSGIAEHISQRYQDICGKIREKISDTLCYCENEILPEKVE